MVNGDCSHSRDESESLLGKAAEEYFSALERGEAASLSEFADRYPEVATEILAVFPALALLGDAAKSPTLRLPPSGEVAPKDLGDYRLIREIGRGGMGIVYEAEQLSLGRLVAVKVLSFASMLDERQLQRFKNEARAAATLHHPHIVPVHAVGCERGVHFYAMQLIEGQSVSELITQMKRRELGASGAFPDARTDSIQSRSSAPTGSFRSEPTAIISAQKTVALGAVYTLPDFNLRDYFRTVARLGIEAAEALAHAHQRGIIHRDIKPENLLIDNAGKLWITDLGLAQVEADAGLTRTGDVIGTLKYMSPEQALGKGVVDQRTDVYSLGVTLYELSTLHPPYPSSDRNGLLNSIASREPLKPRLLNAQLPIDLATIISKAIEKDAADRYCSANELAKDLRRFIEYQPIHARPAGPVERIAKWSRRHVGMVWTLLGASLLGLGLLTVSSAMILHSRSGMMTALKAAAINQERLGESLYAADMRLAGQAWKENDPLRAMELLDHHIPATGDADRRELEWYFLRARCRAPNVEIANTGAAIYDIAFSPDNRLLAAAGQDAVLHIYDWPTMRKAACIPTDQVEVNGVAFSSDGETIATVGDNGELRLWKHLGPLTHRTIKAHVGRAYDIIHSSYLRCWITCGDDQVIRFFNDENGELEGELSGHQGSVTSLELTNDNQTLASTGRDGYARLWDLKGMREIRTFSHHNVRTTTMEFDSRGEFLILGGVALTANSNLLKCHLKSKHRNSAIKFSAHKVIDIAVSSDRGTMAIASDEGVISTIALNPDTMLSEAESTRSWQSPDGGLHRIVFTPDGSQILSAGSDGALRLWKEVSEETHAKWLTPPANVLAVDRIGMEPLVAVAGLYNMGIVDVRTGTFLTELAVNEPHGFIDASPDGSLIAALTASNVVSIWSFDRAKYTCSLKETVPLACAMSGVQISSDNLTLATWNSIEKDGLHLVDMETGNERSGILANGCQEFQWSPDGQFFVAAEDSSDDVIVFDARTFREQWRHNQHSSTVNALAISEDSKLIASADDTRRVSVWDAVNGRELWSTTLSSAGDEWGYARAMQFSPSGRTLFSLQVNGHVTAWNVATGREMLRIDNVKGGAAMLTVCHGGKYICVDTGENLRIIDTGVEPGVTTNVTKD